MSTPLAPTRSIPWSLRLIRAERAWESTRGDGIVIAVLDDAIDTRHPEFEGRVLRSYDADTGAEDALPRGWEPHGTKCAGLALAGGLAVSGVAPEALLMPVRVPALARGVIGDPAEARAIRWAAEHGADVICCAWGPPNPNRLGGALPAHTRSALDWAATHGRGGQGCVIVWSAGNDNCDLALNGYASHRHGIAVGACSSAGKRTSYSNWGAALWCVFPSNDPADPDAAGETYLTTTPVGSFLLGETFYTESFGFTSAACAGVAGLCALILGVNPGLTWRDVKAVLRASCVRLDEPDGACDPTGHSPFLGYGRPDAAHAVALAQRWLDVASAPRKRELPSVQ